jgi:putative ABC transport system permease protein
MWIDLVHAFRVLSRQLALTLTIVVSLSIGLGANTAMFSVVRGVLLKALPYPESDRVADLGIGIYSQAPGAMFGWQFQRWRETTRVMQAMAGYNVKSMPMTGSGFSELVTVGEVTSDFFRVLGSAPYMGSTFREEHQRPGTYFAMLSYRLWQRRYHGDPELVGRTVALDGQPYIVVGIMPRLFSFPQNADCWIALTMTDEGVREVRHAGGTVSVQPARMRGIGRLVESATTDSVAQEGVRLLNRPGVPVTVHVTTLQNMLVGPVRPLLLILQGAALLLLLMVCANITSLLLARGEGRRHELALRLALGAGRLRLVRQALSESALLACAGALGSFALAHWLTTGFKELAPPQVPRLADVDIDAGVLAFGVAFSALTALVCGGLPAARALRSTADVASLRSGGTGPGARGGRAWGLRTLVIAQVAASLILLSGALVLVDAVWRLTRLETGFAAPPGLTARLSIPAASYAATAERLALFQELLDGLHAVPGIEVAAIANHLPFSGGDPRIRFFPQRMGAAETSGEASARWRIVDDRLFRGLGVRIVEGRALADSDVASSPPAVVINQALAGQYFGGHRAVGEYIRLEDNVPRQIIGIAADVKETSLWEQPLPTIYHPVSQLRLYDPFPLPILWMARPYLVITSPLSRPALTASLSRIVEGIDRNLIIDDVSTMQERVAGSIENTTFAAALLSLSGLLALFTAVAGLYGLLAFAVAQRTSEFGVRLALGASPGNLLRLVLHEGIVTMGVGVAGGVVGAWYMARAVRALAYGFAGPPLATLFAASALLITAGLLACWRPARRASRLDPIQALRTE